MTCGGEERRAPGPASSGCLQPPMVAMPPGTMAVATAAGVGERPADREVHLEKLLFLIGTALVRRGVESFKIIVVYIILNNFIAIRCRFLALPNLTFHIREGCTNCRDCHGLEYACENGVRWSEFGPAPCLAHPEEDL